MLSGDKYRVLRGFLCGVLLGECLIGVPYVVWWYWTWEPTRHPEDARTLSEVLFAGAMLGTFFGTIAGVVIAVMRRCGIGGNKTFSHQEKTSEPPPK
jgi:hypothetical protein